MQKGDFDFNYLLYSPHESIGLQILLFIKPCSKSTTLGLVLFTYPCYLPFKMKSLIIFS
jgi:hypothetical protein